MCNVVAGVLYSPLSPILPVSSSDVTSYVSEASANRLAR